MTQIVTAGMFDIQVNGFAGIDFNDAAAMSAEALDHALEAMLLTGVATCLPTVITAKRDELAARLNALDRAVTQSRLGPAMVPGYHLEGPFLNSADGYAGCHPTDAMLPPNAELLRNLERPLLRPILMVTYAPEFDIGERFASEMSAQGKVLAIGHSAANAETIDRARQAGARMSTHLGNGVPQLLPKFNNTIQEQLGCDGLMASFIADGVHVPPHVLRSMLRAKGMARSILVTDAVSAGGMTTPGIYPFAGNDVALGVDGAVRVPGAAYLAGSGLSLDRAVRNVVEWRGARFEDAIAMAGENPHRLFAKAFKRHGIVLPPSTVAWSDALEVVAIRLGDHAIRANSHIPSYALTERES